MVTFSVSTERLSIFISPLARLLAIDSWFKTLHLSGSIIANCFEALQPFPCKLPPPQFLTNFSHPSIYFPLSIEGLLAIDSWFKTLHLSGSVIANCFEALQPFPCILPPPQFLTNFSHPSIYFPLSIEAISSQRIDYWDIVTILEASISSWKVRSMTFCRLCHYFGRMIFSD